MALVKLYSPPDAGSLINKATAVGASLHMIFCSFHVFVCTLHVSHLFQESLLYIAESTNMIQDGGWGKKRVVIGCLFFSPIFDHTFFTPHIRHSHCICRLNTVFFSIVNRFYYINSQTNGITRAINQKSNHFDDSKPCKKYFHSDYTLLVVTTIFWLKGGNIFCYFFAV